METSLCQCASFYVHWEKEEALDKTALLVLFFQAIHFNNASSIRGSTPIVWDCISIATRIADCVKIQQGEDPIDLYVQFFIVRLQFFNLGL